MTPSSARPLNRSLAALTGALLLLSAAQAGADDGPSPEQLTKVARSRVILVVELTEVDEKWFSGMTGSTFWFRVREVVRLEAEERTKADSLWQFEFDGLSAKSKDLASYFQLEWGLLYPEGDQASARSDAELTATLRSAKTLVLALTTTKGMSAMTGTVVANKWGSLNGVPGQVLVLPVDEEGLAAVRAALDDPERAPPPAERALPQAPLPPEEDLHGGRRGPG